MDGVPNQDRDTLVALLDRMLQAETQTEPPLPADRGNKANHISVISM